MINPFANLSSGVEQMMKGPGAVVTPTALTPKSNVPTASQVQSSKLASSLTTNNTARPTVTAPKVAAKSMTNSPEPGSYKLTPPPAQTAALAGSITAPQASNVPDLSNFQANQARAFQAAAPLDEKQFDPYLTQVADANQAVASATNAKRDFERGTYNQAVANGSMSPSQLDTAINAGNRLYNQNIADASTNQLAATQTLSQKLALAQAIRTGQIEQAGVPLTTNKADMQVTPGTSVYNPYNVAAGAQAGGYFGSGAAGNQANPNAGKPFNVADPLDAQVQNYIQSGDMGSIPVQYQGQVLARAKELKPDFNPATAKVAAQGYADSYKSYQDLKGQYDGAQQLGTLLGNTMQEFGINTTDPKYANKTINQIRSQFSDEGYQRFISTLYNTSSAYANILASGGGTIPTEATNNLKAIIDPNSSLETVKGAIDQLNQEVYAGKILPQYSKLKTYSDQINLSAPTGTTETTGTTKKTSTNSSSVGWF